MAQEGRALSSRVTVSLHNASRRCLGPSAITSVFSEFNSRKFQVIQVFMSLTCWSLADWFHQAWSINIIGYRPHNSESLWCFLILPEGISSSSVTLTVVSWNMLQTVSCRQTVEWPLIGLSISWHHTSLGACAVVCLHTMTSARCPCGRSAWIRVEIPFCSHFWMACSSDPECLFPLWHSQYVDETQA